MKDKQITLFRTLFILAAVWNLLGALLGYFNTEFTFQLFFSRELSDPLIYAIYNGAWGTTLVYIIGYLIVAYNPIRHSGIVIVGGIGKVGLRHETTATLFSRISQSCCVDCHHWRSYLFASLSLLFLPGVQIRRNDPV